MQATTAPAAAVSAPPVINPTLPLQRLASVDVYRGFVMLLMMAEILSFRRVAQQLPESGFWQFLHFHQDHVAWTGSSLHDLIQPSFSFLVGVALPFSLASRRARGATFGPLFRHALVRALILIVLGIFLRSMHREQTYFTFEDTLTQIGLGYGFLFLLGFAPVRTQVGALVLILLGYWAAFALYPLPGAGFDYAAAGVSPVWEHHLQGFAAHWNKNTNLAWAFDRWFLNLFPREEPFLFNGGGYATLSFIPTLATMILGLLAGNILRRGGELRNKMKSFLLAAAVLIVLGLLCHYSGLNPIVKRIWTPAWVLYSGGCCFLLLAFFYGLVDGAGYRKWAFPLVVIGMNSIAAYILADGFAGFIGQSFTIHAGKDFAQVFGPAYASLVKGGLVLLVEWYILYRMYQSKIFIKI
ncbi:MAG: acyltransferase family protein [Adhaeribacter sp.]